VRVAVACVPCACGRGLIGTTTNININAQPAAVRVSGCACASLGLLCPALRCLPAPARVRVVRHVGPTLLSVRVCHTHFRTHARVHVSHSRAQAVLSGAATAGVGALSPTDALSVRLLTPIASRFLTSFFAAPQILTRANVPGGDDDGGDDEGDNAGGASDSEMDGYKAGIIVLAIISFVLVLALVFLGLRRAPAAGGKGGKPVPATSSSVNPIYSSSQ
jgi:hypothetical protein